MTIWPRRSTPPTTGFASAPASASAISRAEGEKTSDLALAAARAALKDAGIDAGELDMVICATTTPDETFPATATMVQARLGMTHGAAFDVQAVCSGFIYGLSVADNMIRAGQARTVLLIGAETMSRLLDWSDRTTCVLFGDGAGAVVLQAHEGMGDNSDQGILNTRLFSDGRLHDMLYVDGGPSSTRTTGFLRMQGKEVFRHAVTNIAGRHRPPRPRRRACRCPTSTGSCPTRPTSASWTAPPKSWASPRKR